MLNDIIGSMLSALDLISKFEDKKNEKMYKPLSFYIKPYITKYENNTIVAELEIVVTNGAVGDFKLIDYINGEVKYSANNTNGIITEDSKPKDSRVTIEIMHAPTETDILATNYILANGKDGSKKLGMVLYHIQPQKSIKARYYSSENLSIEEMNKSQIMYQTAFRDFKTLKNKLIADGEL